MIKKTEGIVLNTWKHHESNLIVTLYTRDGGKKSFLAKGVRSTRSRSKYSYFQALSILEVVYFQKEGRSLQTISEARNAYLLQEIQTQPNKLSIGLAIVEVFLTCVKEEEQNEALYLFLKECIVTVDASSQKLVQLFIYYLIHLTRFLGFFPNDESQGAVRLSFDVGQGIILADNASSDPVPLLMRRFLYTNLSECQEISLDTTTKRFLIKTIFEYYKAHIEGFRYPQTLRVFAEVFGG